MSDDVLKTIVARYRFVGLIAGDQEVKAIDGRYVRQETRWTIEEGSAVGSEVQFTGFVLNRPATGMLIASDASDATWLPLPFLSGQTRPIIAVEDTLVVVPSIELTIDATKSQ